MLCLHFYTKSSTACIAHKIKVYNINVLSLIIFQANSSDGQITGRLQEEKLVVQIYGDAYSYLKRGLTIGKSLLVQAEEKVEGAVQLLVKLGHTLSDLRKFCCDHLHPTASTSSSLLRSMKDCDTGKKLLSQVGLTMELFSAYVDAGARLEQDKREQERFARWRGAQSAGLDLAAHLAYSMQGAPNGLSSALRLLQSAVDALRSTSDSQLVQWMWSALYNYAASLYNDCHYVSAAEVLAMACQFYESASGNYSALRASLQLQKGYRLLALCYHKSHQHEDSLGAIHSAIRFSLFELSTPVVDMPILLQENSALSEFIPSELLQLLARIKKNIPSPPSLLDSLQSGSVLLDGTLVGEALACELRMCAHLHPSQVLTVLDDMLSIYEPHKFPIRRARYRVLFVVSFLIHTHRAYIHAAGCCKRKRVCTVHRLFLKGTIAIHKAAVKN